jgi:TatD DNase family protein
MLTDTHCHIHEADYPLNADDVVIRAREAGVETLLCVGTSEQSSREAVAFCDGREGVFAAVGVHPHDTGDGWARVIELLDRYSLRDRSVDTVHSGNIVAVGEIGLDYFYTHSPRATQILALEAQLDAAVRHDLPVVFHVREAFDDFWPIFDNFRGVRGVLHSFTDTRQRLEEGLTRGLYIGVNGISTFTKSEGQKQMFRSIPLNRLLLETDAPFLTPTPFRGTVNEPAFVRNIAEYHAQDRVCSLEEIATTTTANATALFAWS